MVTESIYLLTAILIHLSLQATALAAGGYNELVFLGVKLHSPPLFVCIAATLSGLITQVLCKTLLAITPILFAWTFYKSWKTIIYYIHKYPSSKK